MRRRKTELDKLAEATLEEARLYLARVSELRPQLNGVQAVMAFSTLVEKYMLITGQNKQRIELSGPDGEAIQIYIPSNDREKPHRPTDD